MNKFIDGTHASCLVDAFEHMAKLELELRDIKWRLCWREDLAVSPHHARTHCRKLQEALQMLENRLAKAEAEANVVDLKAKA